MPTLRAFRTEYERHTGCYLAIAALPPRRVEFSQSRTLGTGYLSRIWFVAAKHISQHDPEVVALADRA
jgi:hypothetical protein